MNTVLLARYSKITGDGEITETKNFATKNVEILQTTQLKPWFRTNVKEPILTRMEEFKERDSGWTLVSIISLEININKFTQILGSSYLRLPEPIRKKKHSSTL